MSNRPPWASCTWGTRTETVRTITEARPTDIQNSACQSKLSATQADSGRPMAPPTPRVALMDAIAVLVIAGGVTSRISEMPTGMKPMARPCSTRPVSIGSNESDNAQTREPATSSRELPDEHALLAEHVGEPAGDGHRHGATEQRGGDDP